MKKLLLSIATIALLSLTACSDTKSCYEFTSELTVLGVTTTTTHYMYGTEDDAITQKTLLGKTGATVTYKKVAKSEENCKN